MRKAIFYLGPPLSGKSTDSIAAQIPRFSVRQWFEARRNVMELPEVGTFLSNEIVSDAVETFLREYEEADLVAFDGYPANAEQFQWIRERIGRTHTFEIRYCRVSWEQAFNRMKKRWVCAVCDGGADPVAAKTKENPVCPVCGSKLVKRADDTDAAFAMRWKSYFSREYEMCRQNRFLRREIMKLPKGELRADLHLHSTASDGTESPEALIRHAHEAGMKVCAVTDHDSVSGISEAEGMAKKLKKGFSRGVELSALLDGKVIHILGYGIYPQDSCLQQAISFNQEVRWVFDNWVLDKLTEKNQLREEQRQSYLDYIYDCQRGGWKLLNFLEDCGLCEDGFAYFRLLKELKASEISYLPAADAIAAIRHTGTAVLAHPGTYNWDETELEEKLEKLYQMGIGGVECYHPLNDETVAFLSREFCMGRNLLITGGSDYHGNLSDRNLGSPEYYLDQNQHACDAKLIFLGGESKDVSDGQVIKFQLSGNSFY